MTDEDPNAEGSTDEIPTDETPYGLQGVDSTTGQIDTDKLGPTALGGDQQQPYDFSEEGSVTAVAPFEPVEGEVFAPFDRTGTASVKADLSAFPAPPGEGEQENRESALGRLKIPTEPDRPASMSEQQREQSTFPDGDSRSDIFSDPTPVEDEGSTKLSGRKQIPKATSLPDELSLLPTEPGPAAPDHWADFAEDSSGWSGLTDGQKLKKKSDKRSQPYSRRNTDRYAAQAGDTGNAEELGKVAGSTPSSGAAGARLLSIGGRDEGSEFAVEKREITLGRDPAQCEIVLQEPSVSRNHAQLLYDGERYTIVDNKAGNGTFINGKRVSRARVRSGDEVRLGNAIFRFLEIGDVFKPVDASGAPVLPDAAPASWSATGRRHTFELVAVAAGLLILVMVGVVGFAVLRGSMGDPIDTVNFRRYMDGVELFKQHAWEDADQIFSSLQSVGPYGERATRYIAAIALERKAEQSLAKSKKARDRGKLKAAYRIASQIKNSVFLDEASLLLKGIDAELDAQIAAARSAVERGDAVAARKIVASVRTINPDRQDAIQLWDRVGKPAVVRNEKQESRPPPGPAVNLSAAQTLIAKGKLEKAIAELAPATDDAVRVLREQIQEMQKLIQQGVAAHRSKKAKSAIDSLDAARSTAIRLVSKDSPLVKDIDRRLADNLYLLGLDSFRRQDYPRAFVFLRKAVSKNGHPKAREKLGELSRKAHQVFKDGARAEGEGDLATARKRYSLVMQMLPSSASYHKKAKARLREIR